MTLTARSDPPVARSTFFDPAADIRDEIAAENGIPELLEKIWFQKTASAVIDAGRCVGCGSCIAACPSRSIGVGEDGRPTLIKMCTGCSACWGFCPLAGLRVERLGREMFASSDELSPSSPAAQVELEDQCVAPRLAEGKRAGKEHEFGPVLAACSARAR